MVHFAHIIGFHAGRSERVGECREERRVEFTANVHLAFNAEILVVGSIDRSDIPLSVFTRCGITHYTFLDITFFAIAKIFCYTLFRTVGIIRAIAIKSQAHIR